MSLKNNVISCNFQYVIILNITFKIIINVIPIAPFHCNMSNSKIEILKIYIF